MDTMSLNPPHFTNVVTEEAATWAVVSKPLKLQSAVITHLDMSNPEVFHDLRAEMQPILSNTTFFWYQYTFSLAVSMEISRALMMMIVGAYVQMLANSWGFRFITWCTASIRDMSSSKLSSIACSFFI